MKMYKLGRLCVKLAGRDAGLKCVIIDVIDKNHVMVDGQTRRRKCNIKHIEPLDKVLKVTKNAPRAEIIRVFKGLNIELRQTKPKKKTARPRKIRKKKSKPVKKSIAKQPPKQSEKQSVKQPVTEKK